LTALAALLLGVAAAHLALAQADGSGASHATPEQLAHLQDILAWPEFRAAEGQGELGTFVNPIRTALAAIILTALRWVFSLFSSHSGAPSYGLLALAVLIAITAAVVFTRLIRGTVAAEGAVGAAVAGREPTAGEDWDRALALARAGDLRGAVHHHYLAVLRRLDERGLLVFDRSLTNVEHLRRASSNPAVLEPLQPLVRAFDRLWYSQATCSPAEYVEFVSLAGRAWERSG
jgi:hypothetical protein